MKRKLTTIIAMDVVGYSRLMERDEEATLECLKDIRRSVVDPAIARHSGRTVKLMGDGMLVEFSSVVAALQCAIEIQDALSARNGTVAEEHQVQLRIGIHLGDVIVEGGDVYGDAVNVAARLESIAPPCGIVLSKQVHDHVGDKMPVKFVSLGAQSVKNISRPIEAYRVGSTSERDQAGIVRFGTFELDTALYELRNSG